MNLADRFTGPPIVRGITCAIYQPLPGSSRCTHYLKGGACEQPDVFMCVEWLKANGHAPEPRLALGDKPQASPKASQSTSTSGSGIPITQVLSPPAAPPTDNDLTSLEALQVEVCLVTEDGGEVWLVPGYTSRQDRQELSLRDAATLAAVCAAFPGARVIRLEKAPAEEQT